MTATDLGTAGWFGMAAPNVFAKTFSPQNALVRGHGVRVQDAGGRWYLDARSSLRTLTLGYSHPRVVQAVRQQVEQLPYATTVGYFRPSSVAVEYADELARQMPPSLRHVRFGNCGSQMTDTALLLSRFVRRLRGEHERTEVIALEHAFHGSGAGPSALSGDPYLHEKCRPLLTPSVHHVPPPGPGEADAGVAAVAELIDRIGAERVTAVFLEPVLGRTTTILPDRYVRGVGDLCRRAGIHLVFDEVSTGMGRTGAITRASQLGVVPDLLVLSKGMTSGYVPTAALLLADGIFDDIKDMPFPGFPVGSTTDGHPVAMAAGLAVLHVLTHDRILENVLDRGDQLRVGIERLRRRHAAIGPVRGVGLMTLVELVERDGSPWEFPKIESFRLLAESYGLLMLTQAKGIELAPPLILSADECDEVVELLDRALRGFGS
jgi:adenosylmethionine-8-amino-7-oxononanoate aminotransferase